MTTPDTQRRDADAACARMAQSFDSPQYRAQRSLDEELSRMRWRMIFTLCLLILMALVFAAILAAIAIGLWHIIETIIDERMFKAVLDE